MKTRIAMLFLLAFVPLHGILYAQEQPDTTKKVRDNRPVKSPFESGMLINNITVVNLKKKELEMMIQHRFGDFGNGIYDLAGIYGPSNIRIGFDYGIMEKLQIGTGSTKNGSLQDIRWKAALLRQTRSGSVPVALSYFGNAAYTITKDTARYKNFPDRFSYFHQVLVARKFSKMITVQAMFAFIHHNIVDSVAGYVHDNLEAGIIGHIKFTGQTSVILEYNHPLKNPPKETAKSKPNLGLGIEIATSGHAFQIFVSPYNGILNQESRMFNKNDFTKPKEGIVLGFNITRSWNF